MSMHSEVDYKCEYCDTPFVPIPQSPKCPKCDRFSSVVYPDFVKDTLFAARFHIIRFGSFIPRSWMNIKIGDRYYRQAFQFLNFAHLNLKMSEKELLSGEFSEAKIKSLISEYIMKIKIDNEWGPYIRQRLETYLSLLLKRKAKRFKWFW